MKIPKNMGYGEGGETLPKLGKILQGIVDDLNDIVARVEIVEALEGDLNNIVGRVGALEDKIAKVDALEDSLNDLTARVEALEGEGGGD